MNVKLSIYQLTSFFFFFFTVAALFFQKMFRVNVALTSEANAGQNEATDQRAGELHFEAFNHKSKLR